MTQATVRRKSSGPARLALPARLEISSLGALNKKMRTHYNARRTELVLDGGEVTVIDSAGVQLLVGFVTAMNARGCKLSWENYSVQVYQMASELGLADSLGD